METLREEARRQASLLLRKEREKQDKEDLAEARRRVRKAKAILARETGTGFSRCLAYLGWAPVTLQEAQAFVQEMW